MLEVIFLVSRNADDIHKIDASLICCMQCYDSEPLPTRNLKSHATYSISSYHITNVNIHGIQLIVRKAFTFFPMAPTEYYSILYYVYYILYIIWLIRQQRGKYISSLDIVPSQQSGKCM